MHVTLAFFLGLVSGGLGGIFLIGLVLLIREGLQDARELKKQVNFKRPDGSPAPELWETLRPVPRLADLGQVRGQISGCYNSQVLVPLKRVQAPLEP